MGCWLLALPANSQKVVTRSTTVGIGGTNILDTYLSDEHFKGTGVSILSTIERQQPDCRWSTLMEHEANLSLCNWQLLDGALSLQAGGLVNASLGFIYNTSNGNNPAQARAHLNLMPTGVASYRFQLFHKQMVARYELNLPLAGIQFSPNYGQSYYEIFNRGDYDHNVVPTTFVCAPEWRNLLTLDAAITRKITLRIGYLGNIQQMKVNNLRQHVWTHRFLIGITKRFSITPHAL